MAEVSISGSGPVDVLEVSRRLQKRSDWASTIEPMRNQLIKEGRANGLLRPDAQAWAYSELDRLYPPEPEPTAEEPTAATISDQEDAGVVTALAVEPTAEPPQEAEDRARTREDGVTGLSSIPPSWPPLPPNASLAAEIQWVQSSRLDVVEELPGGGVRVHLERADRPAPSKAAIGWLETSIRAYGKYCDIAAKATSQAEDEREHVRRERMAIEEVRALLSEMVDGQG